MTQLNTMLPPYCIVQSLRPQGSRICSSGRILENNYYNQELWSKFVLLINHLVLKGNNPEQSEPRKNIPWSTSTNLRLRLVSWLTDSINIFNLGVTREFKFLLHDNSIPRGGVGSIERHLSQNINGWFDPLLISLSKH